MAFAHEVPEAKGWLARLLTTDFCPWANRFVYWLKEPVGWFVLAIGVSVMVGTSVSPVGWTLAAALSGLMVVGMVWPLVAVYATRCELRPEVDAVHEGEVCHMVLSVRNRIPLPVWGLAVEGYLDGDAETDQPSPTVGLGSAPPLCVAEYRVAVRPSLRGRYPLRTPAVACAFPFGIWTARRRLQQVQPLTVWPKVYRISGECPLLGRTQSDRGNGRRGGRQEDFTGLRDYRRGDLAKHVNWIASARTDSLVVTERSGPQSPTLQVIVEVTGTTSRQRLADRIRVAASLLVHLHQASIPMRVAVGPRVLLPVAGNRGRRQILDALAEVPLDGLKDDQPITPSRGAVAITISSDDPGDTLVRLINPRSGRRLLSGDQWIRVESGHGLDEQLQRFWAEASDVGLVA
jgi:uncharacterized protein (DUF58 family)